jgi:hypothetical protein
VRLRLLAAAPSETKTSSESKPAGDDFCGQLEANGADATTFVELQAFLPPAGGRLTDPDLVSNPSASKASKPLADY